MKREYLSPWKKHLDEFYKYRQLCGIKSEKDETYIFLFDRYYLSLGIETLEFNRDIVEGYVQLRPGERITNQLHRATFCRQFAKYIFKNDLLSNVYIVPPLCLKGEAIYIPYIYSKLELHNIVKYLDNYTSTAGTMGRFNLLPNTINSVSTVIKILISTGMRCGEVINLKLSNVDLENKLFIIEKAKNDNQRIVPFSNSLKQVLLGYIDKTPFRINKEEFLFQIDYGIQISRTTLHKYFYNALKNCGIPHIRGKGPRIHDFRHTFAVMSLTQLQHNEVNVNLSLSYLSTYLGHKSIKETQKYIWMTPSLFEDVKKNMQDYSNFIMDIFEGEKFDED